MSITFFGRALKFFYISIQTASTLIMRAAVNVNTLQFYHIKTVLCAKYIIQYIVASVRMEESLYIYIVNLYIENPVVDNFDI